ncbi:hypothetical protein C8A00DRAFT_28629 [Chaetomidium leptoderma]|uniref:Uncharacterized protein n=1 Tax=Chaetomidium leptoderma TaxID=669021 RepID=A0AAN7A1W8_9PEZI|nr:hypothetical protein C8A00DRAFT_28629 [Chaetomidium leptoderma]
MASSSSQGAARVWPGFALGWVNRKARPSDMRRRMLGEYIAGIGMIQVNEERHQNNLPAFRYATIVHAFIQNVKADFKALRDSYHDPVLARLSLAPTTETETPVGHTIADGVSQWYIVDEETEGLVYLELKAFFRAGEGDKEHFQFWDPLKNKICRAAFLGNEQPQPPSPDPLPSNLEAAMSDLSIATPPAPTVVWVKLELKLDKKTSKPVQFITETGKEKRTGWEKWEAKSDEDRQAFLCVEPKTGTEYWAEYLPGDWVLLRRKSSSDRPIQFRNADGDEIETKEAKWIAGRGESFFAYMDGGRAYLAKTLPP